MTGPTERARIPAFVARFDPERVAAMLSVAVVATVGVILIASGGTRPAASSSGAPIVQPTLGPTSAGPSDPASAAPTPARPAGLAILIDTNVGILRAREDLIAETTASNPDAGVIARALRALNPLLAAAEAQTRSVVSPTDPRTAEDLLAAYEAARDASTRTLRGSVSSTPAYVEGGQEVADVLASIGPLTRRIAELAGVEPPPEARATTPPSSGAAP